MCDASDDLEHQFAKAKKRAAAFAEKYNGVLPTEECPECHSQGHCPGLPCPDCGYTHPISWGITLDTEWGYKVVAIADRKQVIKVFNVRC